MNIHRRHLFLWPVACWAAGPPKTAAAAAPAQVWPLDALPAGAVLRKVTAAVQEHAGRKALRVELTDEVSSDWFGRDYGDKPTFVRIPAGLKDGRIEVDLWARRNGKGPKDARAFVGLAYRINADASAYESVYLRPLNGRKLNPPAPRDLRAVQYYAYPDWKFDRLRSEYPDGRYEAGADIRDAEWTTLRLELDGPRVQVFVNDQPVLDLKEAKATPVAGDIGLWVDIGTEAWFQNLRVQPR